jgi:hypothetical protein
LTDRKNKYFFIVDNNTISKQSAINRSMSQFELVNVSLEVEGESVKLNYRIAKRKPCIPGRVNINKALMNAGEFVLTKGTKGDIVSIVRNG